MFAVLDIESSGGKPGEEKIIDIAVFLYDGDQVVDQLISLVNPQKDIQVFVQKLTGITPKMVARAPRFHELAKRLVEITQDAVIVGHNIGFDYRVIKNEFESLGYPFERKILDTIPLTQKLIPGLKSYGLAQITKELDLYNSARHRAEGDARVTLDLFKILIQKDESKIIWGMIGRLDRNITDNEGVRLARMTENLVGATGVYYLLDDQKKILYLGSSKNVRNHINNFFLEDNPKNDALKNQVAEIKMWPTGNDLLSHLHLYNEYKKLKPKYNDKQPGPNLNAAWIIENGKIKIKKQASESNQELIKFSSHFVAQATYAKLKKTIHENLDKLEDIDFIKSLFFPAKDFIIEERGRETGEKAIVYFENYKCFGFGYYKLQEEFLRRESFIKKLYPIQEDAYILGLVIKYMNQYPERIKIMEQIEMKEEE
jgi:DNA polymerase-3 subunit epsilon